MSRQRVVAGGQLEVVTPGELAEILQAWSRSSHIGFGNGKIEKTLRNWPVVGHERIIRIRNQHGNPNLVIPASPNPVDIFPSNDGRGGLSIVNIGANPAIVFLDTAAEAAQNESNIACGYLFANNGTWDGKFGNAEWLGPVSVLSALGTTLVTGEF